MNDERKMVAWKIKKALKQHASDQEDNCVDCPYYSMDCCIDALCRDALTLIKHREAENLRLRAELLEKEE